jgi:ADP-ribosylglycohydrolase
VHPNEHEKHTALYRQQKLPADLPKLSHAEIKDRILGAILAAACGNSLGGSCIGLTRKDLQVSTGYSMLRDFLPGLSRSQRPEHKPGEILSDTYLALSIAESVITSAGQLNKDDVRQRFSNLLHNNQFLTSQASAITLALLRAEVDNIANVACDIGDMQIADVSAAARIVALGCLPGPPKTRDIIDLAVSLCEPVHSDKQVMAAAAVITDSINYLVRGGPLKSEGNVRAYVQRELDLANSIDERFAEAWDGIAPDLDYSVPAKDLPYSLINVETNINELVPTAVGIFLIFRHSLEEAICAAALSGGDTDTVAFLVGALAGACHGAKAIPPRWTDSIAHRPQLEDIANRLTVFWEDQ